MVIMEPRREREQMEEKWKIARYPKRSTQDRFRWDNKNIDSLPPLFRLDFLLPMPDSKLKVPPKSAAAIISEQRSSTNSFAIQSSSAARFWHQSRVKTFSQKQPESVQKECWCLWKDIKKRSWKLFIFFPPFIFSLFSRASTPRNPEDQHFFFVCWVG